MFVKEKEELYERYAALDETDVEFISRMRAIDKKIEELFERQADIQKKIDWYYRTLYVIQGTWLPYPPIPTLREYIREIRQKITNVTHHKEIEWYLDALDKCKEERDEIDIQRFALEDEWRRELLLKQKPKKRQACQKLMEEVLKKDTIKDENGNEVEVTPDLKMAFVEEIKQLMESEKNYHVYDYSEAGPTGIVSKLEYKPDLDVIGTVIMLEDDGTREKNNHTELDKMLLAYKTTFEKKQQKQEENNGPSL